MTASQTLHWIVCFFSGPPWSNELYKCSIVSLDTHTVNDHFPISLGLSFHPHWSDAFVFSSRHRCAMPVICIGPSLEKGTTIGYSYWFRVTANNENNDGAMATSIELGTTIDPHILLFHRGPICIPWSVIPAIVFFLWKFAKPLLPKERSVCPEWIQQHTTHEDNPACLWFHDI